MVGCVTNYQQQAKEKNMRDWLLKVRRYAPPGMGGESIVASFHDQGDANREAADRNSQYQTDTYFVEKFDPAKLTGWVHKPLSELSDEELTPDW
jgi:hypothetical protein